MIRSITAETWKSLRVLVRANSKPLTGKELRTLPTVGTKDGTFLDKLVACGLIAVVEQAEAEKPKFKDSRVKPVQFRTTYELTELGRHAAEYGEYKAPDPVRTEAKAVVREKGKSRNRR